MLVLKLRRLIFLRFMYICVNVGHWTYAASFYKKQLTLDHLIATYKKPTVSFLSFTKLPFSLFCGEIERKV